MSRLKSLLALTCGIAAALLAGLIGGYVIEYFYPYKKGKRL